MKFDVSPYINLRDINILQNGEKHTIAETPVV